ncbi:UbiA family prenyltransferase [Haloferax mediterranei ATCC 33500]|nr:UbiA family prenyltransferase [Haloferax mediterranei]MDX5990254.1 UbiA family prenyltransferase [Haloferax mediterranei ATCC 33500]
MLPPLAASWFGSILAGEFSLFVGAVHMGAIFCAVYTAHVKDGYVDFHVRNEDDDHPLTVTGCRIALAGAALAFIAALIGLWALAGPGAALLTLPTWVIGYLHAPQLDMHPIGATMGYPLGIALTIVSASYVQSGIVPLESLAFGLVFLVLLSGVKTIDDAQDYTYDSSIGKPTVAVVLGQDTARRVAYGIMTVGLGLVMGFAVGGVFPPSTVLAVGVFAPVAAIAWRKSPTLATMLLIRGAYLFLASLIAAVWFHPFV